MFKHNLYIHCYPESLKYWLKTLCLDYCFPSGIYAHQWDSLKPSFLHLPCLSGALCMRGACSCPIAVFMALKWAQVIPHFSCCVGTWNWSHHSLVSQWCWVEMKNYIPHTAALDAALEHPTMVTGILQSVCHQNRALWGCQRSEILQSPSTETCSVSSTITFL